MNPHFSIFGLQFYWYGLLLGLSIALVMYLVDRRAVKFDRLDFSDKRSRVASRTVSLQLFFQQWSVVLVVGGLIGARAWHVATDWHRYVGDWFAVLELNQGGLSILGAIVGGVLTLMILRRFVPSVRLVPALLICDALVFGLPFGQAVGRVGNWINQELYGLPTTLPWGIPIDVAHRLPDFVMYERYHPLFAYEALVLIGLGLGIWWLDRRMSHLFGSGFFTLLYLTIYSSVRFLLDFLRIDRAVWQFGLGANQVVPALCFIGTIVVWWRLVRTGYFVQPNETVKQDSDQTADVSVATRQSRQKKQGKQRKRRSKK